MTIKKRGKKWSLYKRVPKRYAAIEPRKFVWLSLHTDSESEAARKSVPAWDQMIAAWEAKLAGDTSDAAQRFEAARELAAARGFHYLSADRVAELPLEEIARRMERVSMRHDEPEMVEAAAVLGGAQEPAITVKRALELY